MLRLALIFALAAPLYAAERFYELRGRLIPESPAAISLFGATTPFHAETLADVQGRFRFRRLASGQYTIAVFIPAKGEIRRTVELGRSTANAKGCLDLEIPVDDSLLVSGQSLQDRVKVSARELAISEKARREYADAQRELGRGNAAAAVALLEHAVAIAPQFVAAWNNLGTIAYQTRQYARADECFRKAIAQNPGSYEPLVNLGGVLLNEGKPEEALSYNRYAVVSRPRDALANAQLGMNYFAIGNLESGEKYLDIAKSIDPAHFSFPQLTLARIHLLRNERGQAAQELRDFLRHHPDAPESVRVREQLAGLEGKTSTPPATAR